MFGLLLTGLLLVESSSACSVDTVLGSIFRAILRLTSARPNPSNESTWIFPPVLLSTCLFSIDPPDSSGPPDVLSIKYLSTSSSVNKRPIARCDPSVSGAIDKASSPDQLAVPFDPFRRFNRNLDRLAVDLRAILRWTACAG